MLLPAALVLVPMGVLIAFGLHALRADRRWVEQEAREAAQASADLLVEDLWTALVDRAPAPSQRPAPMALEIDARGELLVPAPYATTPAPQPLPEAGLSSTLAALWRAGQRMDPGSGDAWEKFLKSDPPDRFAAIARFQLGGWLAARSRWSEAESAFGEVVEKHPEVVGETGLPLRPLALLRGLEASRRAGASAPRPRTTVDRVASNAVATASAVTVYVLDALAGPELGLREEERARVADWRVQWERDEELRRLHRALRPAFVANSNGNISVPRLRWIPPDGGPLTRSNLTASWLAVRHDGGKGRTRIEMRSGTEFQSGIRAAETATMTVIAHWRTPPDLGPSGVGEVIGHPRIWRDYFGLSLEVAGLGVVTPEDLPILAMGPGGKAAGVRLRRYDGVQSGSPAVLGRATRFEDGLPWLRAQVHLISPPRLYELQRQRTATFGLVLGGAAVAALAGFALSWRGYRRLRQLSELKSNFVSSVSHELRAPIASVRLMAEGLERGRVSDPDRQKEYFHLIGQECRRLSALIENVLDFARIEQGRKVYEFEPTDLRALVQQTVRGLEPMAAEKRVQLSLQLPPDGTGVHPAIDGPALQQALVNLLDNALKHAPPGSAVIVTLAADEGGCSVSVADNGPGIPESEHGRIFERFHRLGSELRRETPGVGIGLSIVKHIMDAHGGRVRLESSPGRGSRFILDLPQPTAGPASAAAAATA